MPLFRTCCILQHAHMRCDSLDSTDQKTSQFKSQYWCLIYCTNLHTSLSTIICVQRAWQANPSYCRKSSNNARKAKQNKRPDKRRSRSRSSLPPLHDLPQIQAHQRVSVTSTKRRQDPRTLRFPQASWHEARTTEICNWDDSRACTETHARPATGS
jgi:hypothetical protein